MKLFFITSTLTSGGSERVMSILANELIEREHDISIICINKHIVFYPINHLVSVLFVEEEIASKSIAKKMKWLRNYVKSQRPDVVIPFMEAVYCVTLLALVGIHIPVISSERIDPRKSPVIRNFLRRLFLPMTTHLVVQTEDIKSFYPSFIKKKTSIIYNPVVEDVFYSQSPFCNEKDNRLISVGKLDYQKNQQMMIRAFAKIQGLFPEWKLIIYGEGPLRTKLENLISSYRLQDKVVLPGRTESVIDEMRQSKVFCFSSNFEGMSNAMIEAICLGLPVVTTRVSGVSELIEEEKNGFVVSCNDIDALADRMKRLMSDDDLRKTMSINNISKASMFKLDNIVNQWETLIMNVVSNYRNRGNG